MRLGALLFLCGGRRVGLLRHFRRGLQALGGGRILTTDTELYAATKFVADRTVLVAPCRSVESFVADVAAICESEAVTAIIPLTCAAVAAIPALRRYTAAFIISGDEQAIRICTDKEETARHFQRAGLITPPYSV